MVRLKVQSILFDLAGGNDSVTASLGTAGHHTRITTRLFLPLSQGRDYDVHFGGYFLGGDYVFRGIRGWACS